MVVNIELVLLVRRSSGRDEDLKGSGWEFVVLEEDKVISSVFIVGRCAFFGIGSLSSAMPASELFSETTSFRLESSVVRAAGGCEGVELLGCDGEGVGSLGERERNLDRLLPYVLVLLFISTMCSSAKMSISLSTFCTEQNNH